MRNLSMYEIIANYIPGALSMLQEKQFFIKSSLFRLVPIEANDGNIAMQSFFKIMVFFSENYEFFNILKFFSILTFQK